MLKIAVIAALVSLAFAAEKKDEECCTPAQWEGFIGFQLSTSDDGEEPSFQISAVEVHIDHPGQRSLVKYADDFVDPDNPQRAFALTIYNYNEDSTRIYEGRKDGSCKYFSIPKESMPNRCLNELGFFVDRYNMGLDIPVVLYAGLDGTTVIAQEPACIPLSAIAVEGGFGRNRLLSAGSRDLSAGIKDENVFDPPANCEPAYKKTKIPFL